MAPPVESRDLQAVVGESTVAVWWQCSGATSPRQYREVQISWCPADPEPFEVYIRAPDPNTFRTRYRTGRTLAALSRHVRSPVRERVKLARELFARRDDGIPPSDRQGHGILPSIARSVQVECIPHCVSGRLQSALCAAVEHRRQVREVGCTKATPLVPIV